MRIRVSEEEFFEWCEKEGIELPGGHTPSDVDYVEVRSYDTESHAYGYRGDLEVETYWDSCPPLSEDLIESLLQMSTAELVEE